jgi:hypothetical protein
MLIAGGPSLYQSAFAQVEPPSEPSNTTEGDLNQTGDNTARNDNDVDQAGGDGVAGSNVIGAAGTGDTSIEANNDSENARSEGGDVEHTVNNNVDNGPDLKVVGGDTTVTAQSTGSAVVQQFASPTVTITLDQVSNATGSVVVTNTGTALTTLDAVNNATGNGNVTQTATGSAIVSPTAIANAAAAPTAFGTATAPLPPAEGEFPDQVGGDYDGDGDYDGFRIEQPPANCFGFALAEPDNGGQFGDGDGDLDGGTAEATVFQPNGADLINLLQSDGVSNQTSNVTGTALMTQTAIAAPTAAPECGATALNAPTATVESDITPSADNNSATFAPTLTGNGGDVTQSITQGGTTSVDGPTVGLTTTAGNTADPTGSAPVIQTATVVSNPVATALAGPNTLTGALNQTGDNRVRNDVDVDGAGGDAIAGSQVIGVAGAGDTSIIANNTSDNARAEGGEVEGEVNNNLDSGPEALFAGGDTTVTAIATGTALISQTATPTVTIDITQTSNATGTAIVSNTGSAVTSATAVNNATGNGNVSQTATGDAIVSATAEGTDNSAPAAFGDAIASPTCIGVAVAAPQNNGDADVIQPNFADLINLLQLGGESNQTSNVTGTAVLSQTAIAAPTAAPSCPNSATNAPTATSSGTIAPSASGNSATFAPTLNGTGGDTTQGITQDPTTTAGGPTVTLDTSATNSATPTGTAPVEQTATAESSPTATALAGPNTTDGELNLTGDNRLDNDNDIDGVGGDGIAGSNVIGVAGAGDTSINASNNSGRARGFGGDVETTLNNNLDNGPDITVAGGSTDVTAIATGTALISQTATPTVTIDIDQTSNATGTAIVSNTSSAITNLSATNNATGNGNVTQTVTGGSLVSASAVGTDNSAPTAFGTATASPTCIGEALGFPTNNGDADVIQPNFADLINLLQLGGVSNQTSNVTGTAVLSQTAISAPTAAPSCPSSATNSPSATSSGTISPSADGNTATFSPSLTGTGGNTTQTTTQTPTTSTGGGSVTLTTTTSNTASPTASSPVNQTATTTSSPTVIASSP